MLEPAQFIADRIPTPEQIRDLLHRVQQSPVFSRSPALRAFLGYIVDNAVAGNLEQIKEQSIGAVALGRGPNYDPTTDNIVRVRAHELRQKLERYFETVGVDEQVIISIPLGAYVPEFRFRTVYAPPPTEDPGAAKFEHPPPALALEPAVPVRIRLVLPWILVVALAAALVFTLLHKSRTPMVSNARQPAQAVRDFWGPVLSDPSRQALAIFADSGFALWQNVYKQHLNLGDYLAREYLNPGRPDPRMREMAARRLTSPADVSITARLVELSLALGGHLVPVYARNLQVQQIREANAVLIGSSRSNPWVELFEPKLNFVLVRDEKTGASFFRNLSPKPGEAPLYNVSEVFASSGTEEHEVDSYALIAAIPGLADKGRMVLIEGLNMEGTDAAGEMVTDPVQLTGLLREMGHPFGTPVAPFEALLKLNSVPGGYANSKAIAFRYLKK